MTTELFALNPRTDLDALARRFADERRVQVNDFLTPGSALAIQDVLLRGTRWELAWQAGDSGPRAIDNATLSGPHAAAAGHEASGATDVAARKGEYSCRFASYPMLQAYLDRRAPDGPHDRLLEYINTPEMLDLVRAITGIPELVKADAQASLFAGNHYLGWHSDTHKGQGWRVAYVMGFAPDDWKPDWGGYLQFFDERGDIVCGWKPRFNVLNLFAVPCPHAVSYVPPFAPNGRISITGWFRDR